MTDEPVIGHGTETSENRLAGFLSSRFAALFIGLMFVILTAWAWVGFLGSDDVTYAIGAYGWIEEFPYVGGHGTIRYPITIPMALSFLTLGGNEVAMVMPSYLGILLLLFLLWYHIDKIVGTLGANLSLLLVATTPLLVIQATIASVDIVEALFLFSSFFMYWKYVEGDRKNRYLIAAGGLAGLAFLTRETAVFVAIFYGILFLRGYRIPRQYYLLIALGFIAIWLVEICYLWIMTGDPLYRFNISLNHDSTIDRSIDVAGNFIIHPALDPLLLLLFNQEFMLLFWLGIPLNIWICFFDKRDSSVRRFARLLTLFGVAWFVAVGAAVTLLPLNPRYFMITAIAVAVVSGLSLHQIWMHSGKTLILASIIGGMMMLNMLGIYVENKNPLFGERQYAAIISRSGETIYTDPMTRYRANLLLKWVEAGPEAMGEAPPEDSLFYYNPARVATVNRFMDEPMQRKFQPKPSWEIVEEYRAKPDLVLTILDMIGADKYIPGSIWSKVNARYPATRLYRVRSPDPQSPN